MKVHFYKYQGAGNDFVILDNRTGLYSNLSKNAVNKLCDRRFGIGADGLMILQPHNELDFEMLYYNADGLPGSMCGNGGRCIVAFARQLGVISSETNFLAVDGPHYAKISDNGVVHLQMSDVDSFKQDGGNFIMDTGSPHFIKEVTDLESIDVFNEGRAIRNRAEFIDKGINVNFTERVSETLHVRTYERGVEDETFACGTGVTAAAIADAVKNDRSGEVTIPISVKGGKLEVRFRRSGDSFSNIFLKGPAELVFEGKVEV